MYFTTYQQLLEYAEFEKLLDSLAAVAAKGHGHGAESLYGAVSKIHGQGFARCSLAGKSNCNRKIARSTHICHSPFTTILSSSFLTSASYVLNCTTKVNIVLSSRRFIANCTMFMKLQGKAKAICKVRGQIFQVAVAGANWDLDLQFLYDDEAGDVFPIRRPGEKKKTSPRVRLNLYSAMPVSLLPSSESLTILRTRKWSANKDFSPPKPIFLFTKYGDKEFNMKTTTILGSHLNK